MFLFSQCVCTCVCDMYIPYRVEKTRNVAYIIFKKKKEK